MDQLSQTMVGSTHIAKLDCWMGKNTMMHFLSGTFLTILSRLKGLKCLSFRHDIGWDAFIPPVTKLKDGGPVFAHCFLKMIEEQLAFVRTITLEPEYPPMEDSEDSDEMDFIYNKYFDIMIWMQEELDARNQKWVAPTGKEGYQRSLNVARVLHPQIAVKVRQAERDFWEGPDHGRGLMYMREKWGVFSK